MRRRRENFEIVYMIHKGKLLFRDQIIGSVYIRNVFLCTRSRVFFCEVNPVISTVRVMVDDVRKLFLSVSWVSRWRKYARKHIQK